MNGRLRLPRAAALAAILLLFASCPNAFMKAVQAKVASDQAKVISVFGFTAAANAKLYKDVAASIDATSHTLTLMVPKWVPLTNLVATFQFQGAAVTVNGAAQTSGVTPNDFSSPVKYRVTPASGTPVVYTVTATTGSQGLMGGVIQGTPLNLSGTVTTVAGAASPFGNPMGVVRVGTSLYIADPKFSVIWQVNVNSGAVTLFAGILGNPGFANGAATIAQFDKPEGLATDGTNLYVADKLNNMIRSINISTGYVTSITTSGVNPNGLYYNSIDSTTGTLYETDIGDLSVKTFAVTVSSGALASESIIISSGLTSPEGLTIYSGNLCVVDAGTNAVYEYASTGGALTHTISGSSPAFNAPTGIAVSGGYLYVADTGNNIIQKIDPITNASSVYLGSSSKTSGHADGKPAAVMLDAPNMLFVDSGIMYVTEAGNMDVRAITSSGDSSTLAGVWPGSTNGSGSAARFNNPRQMATNGSTLWIGDQSNDFLRSMDLSSYSVNTAAGTGAEFNTIAGMTTDGKYIYICDSFGYVIRRLAIATGQVTTIAGSLSGYADGIGSVARFGQPTGITTDGTNLYVTDTGNDSIRMIELASGSFQVTTIAGSPPLSGKVLGDIDNAIGTSATFNNPYQITTDGNSLFVACGTNESIRQISLTASGYPVTTIAGPKISFSGTRAGYVNGSALNCPGGQFNTPTGITTDGTNLYVTDVGNQVIRKIVIASGAVTTLAGAMPPLVTTAEIDGTGTAARFNNPVGITTDGVSLYVTDALSNAIRMIR